jgi:hypothetical protein
MAFNIKYAFDLIDNLSPQLKKVKANISKAQTTIKNASVKAGKSFDHMRQKLDKFGSKVRDVGKSLFLKLTVPIGALGAAFVKAASDAEEITSKFGTVFKEVSSQAENTANTLATSFGLSSIKAKELIGDTGDLLTGFGFTGQSALDLSRQVNELAVDLASFTNFSGGAEGASKALTKALLGERESVKSLGISILEEDVKKKVAILTAQGFRFESERQAKAVATLKIALDQSKNAIGDYARTNTSFANRMRVLSARFHDFRILLGNILLPIALKLVNITIRLIEKFNGLNPSVKKIILIVGGLLAVLSPLLIAIGFMLPAITAFGTGFAALGTPILFIMKLLKGLAVFAAANPFMLLVGAAILIAMNWEKVIDIFKSVWEWIGKLKDSALTNLTENIGKIKDFLGFGGGDNIELGNREINQTLNTNINKRQDVNIGGRLDIFNQNAQRGTSMSFTPAPDNQLPVGTNMTFQGAR